MIEALSNMAMPAANSQAHAIRKTSEEYEGIFISTLLETMFANVETDGPFGGGESEKMYRSMMVEQYGSAIAKNGGIGVADAIAREMLALQEI